MDRSWSSAELHGKNVPRCAILVVNPAERLMVKAGLRIVFLLVLVACSQEQSFEPDGYRHSVRLVTVERDVRIEVLDYGGTGPSLVLLAGLGNDAHIFDAFATTSLTSRFHVYALSRRGFGASSAPSCCYDANRLGDDVLAVMTTLRIERPILVGHSIGGEELSSIASRVPERVAGLVYLDCYSYAFDDGTLGPEVVADSATPRVPRAILEGVRTFTNIRVPSLWLFASPRRAAIRDEHGRVVSIEEMQAHTERQARAVERGLSTARVVRIPGSTHYLHVTNRTEVLRELDAFIATLQRE